MPAAGARLVPDTTDVAYEVSDGVRVFASLDDPRGFARELPADVTPIKIRVVNHGARPVSILYDHFYLRGRRGHHYRAIPVVPLEHAKLAGTVAPLRPYFASSKFQVAARYHDVYSQLDPWPAPLLRDEGVYEQAYLSWSDHPPSREVMRMALPEGVLGPEGEITGYVYFERPARSDADLSLDAALVSARNVSEVSSVQIPLRME
ncbi:MAG TPA: hypothetical protein VHL80_16030 [Polyangia bacterium]|nr:hypothetical protein [Polyangia bacterium]